MSMMLVIILYYHIIIISLLLQLLHLLWFKSMFQIGQRVPFPGCIIMILKMRVGPNVD
jgi:hypothetical protein